MGERRIEDADALAALLAWDGAVPPPIGGDGACLALRAAMARFSGPELHPARRADMEVAIAGVDVAALTALTSEAAQHRLGPPELDAVELARQVPVAALGALVGLVGLGADGSEAAALVADVDAVAAVIGRGAPTSPAADDAAERLLAAAAGGPRGPGGPVATVSMLYQCLDATAALLLTTLHARAAGADRVAAIPRTRRVALVAGSVGGVAVDVGDDLVLEIGAAGMEFGAGPHACPGREPAEAIVRTVVADLDGAGYTVVDGSVVVDADGRPTAMTLRRR